MCKKKSSQVSSLYVEFPEDETIPDLLFPDETYKISIYFPLRELCQIAGTMRDKFDDSTTINSKNYWLNTNYHPLSLYRDDFESSDYLINNYKIDAKLEICLKEYDRVSFDMKKYMIT